MLFFGAIWVVGALEGEVYRFFGIRYPGKGRSLAFPAAKPGELATGIVPDGVFEINFHCFFVNEVLKELCDETILETEALEARPPHPLFIEFFNFFDHADFESVFKTFFDPFMEDFFRWIEDEDVKIPKTKMRSWFGDFSKGGDDFESADEAEWILPVDSRGSGRILCFKQSVELIGGLGAEVVPQDRIGRNSRKTRSFEECLDPEMRAAAENRLFATHVNVNNRVMCVSEEVRNIVFFIRIGDIDEVMPDATGNIWGINV